MILRHAQVRRIQRVSPETGRHLALAARQVDLRRTHRTGGVHPGGYAREFRPYFSPSSRVGFRGRHDLRAGDLV